MIESRGLQGFIMSNHRKSSGLQSASLQRSIGLSSATSMVVGIIVGVSIFVQPSEVTRLVASGRGVMLAWLASGLLTLCAALVCAELSWLFPENGGVYVFLKRIYSPALAFLWGWTMFWTLHSGILAAIAVLLARYAGHFFHLGETGVRVLAIGAVLAVSLVQYLGVKLGSAVQVALTAAKLAAIVILARCCSGWDEPFTRLCRFPRRTRPRWHRLAWRSLRDYFLLAAGTWFLCCGRDPRSGKKYSSRTDFWRAHGYGLLHASECRLPVCHAAGGGGRLVPGCGGRRGARAWLSRRRGDHRGHSYFGARRAEAALLWRGPRLLRHGAGRPGFPLDGRRSIPAAGRPTWRAILAQAIWTCVLAATNSYRTLFTRVVYTEWLFFALLAAGVLILRRRGQYTPKFLAPAFPFLPAISLVTSAAVAADQYGLHRARA